MAFDEGETRALLAARQSRLREIMRATGAPALLTPFPINILYACGARNMTVFSMMGPARLMLIFAEGPCILYEFPNSAHLAEGLATVDEIRPAPSLAAYSGPGYLERIAGFAAEIASECRARLGAAPELWLEKLDFPVTDALRGEGLRLADAALVFREARRIKLPGEIGAMREAIRRVELGAAALEAAIDDGATEVEIWAEFHRDLIAREGEYVSTRLLQAGSRTFPYFQEAGREPIRRGELLAFDTDALGHLHYAVDFSRTFLCGADRGDADQRRLYALAMEQLEHNAGLLAPGRSYEEMARAAWIAPERHRESRYFILGHGLGMSGEFPYIPYLEDGAQYGLPGAMEAGMVICVESYVGERESGQGVKLEDQFLITESGVERLSRYPFADALAPREV